MESECQEMGEKHLISVKFIQRRYLPEILKNESRTHSAFKSPASSWAWQEEDFIRFLGQRKTRGYVVEEGDNNPVGLLLVDYADPAEFKITRLTVNPDYRRSGFGEALLEYAVSLAKKTERTIVTAYVYEQDYVAQEFFKAAGWNSELIKNYFGQGEGAVRFSTRIERE